MVPHHKVLYGLYENKKFGETKMIDNERKDYTFSLCFYSVIILQRKHIKHLRNEIGLLAYYHEMLT